jgi:hypothetical protein
VFLGFDGGFGAAERLDSGWWSPKPIFGGQKKKIILKIIIIIIKKNNIF